MCVICRRLLEKYAQYQEQLAQLQARGEVKGEGGRGEEEEEEEEMEEVLTPDEKSTAEGVKKTIQKWVFTTKCRLHFSAYFCMYFCRLEEGELQLDETVMALSNYVCMA